MALWRTALATASFSLALPLPARCTVEAFDVTPEFADAPSFELIVQYVESQRGVKRFSVCADTSGVPGDLHLTVRLIDESGLVGGWCVCPMASDLGCAWFFEIRSDLAQSSAFTLINDQSSLNGHNLPAGAQWTFHLGPLLAQAFHVEPDWQCPSSHAQTPGFEHVEVHVFHLKDGKPVAGPPGG